MIQPVESIVILGGGSAGLIAALTLQRLMPGTTIELFRSREIGVIGVGEGTTAVFPTHLFNILEIPPEDFYRDARPTWKHGIKFLWGPRDQFFYSFTRQYDQQRHGMPRANGFYAWDDCSDLDLASALMARAKAFPTGPLGKPVIAGEYAFHIENHALVEFLEKLAAKRGITLHDETLLETSHEGDRITELVFRSGIRCSADLIIDASGFRAELIGNTLGEPFKDYSHTLFCDRAIVAGWERTDETLHTYTTAETMDSGWSWQIEHENRINRGYVYASAFISDEQATREFLTKNPKITGNPRVVPFRSGRRERNWVGNVVAVGNASGFVEPLEATALAQLIFELRWLAEKLRITHGRPDDATRSDYNRIIARAWDEIRDFLGYHYRFNTRLDTPFWQHCRSETRLGDFEEFHQAYRRLGPSLQTRAALPYPDNIYGIEGYLAMLVGMQVPHQAGHQPSAQELATWQRHQRAMRLKASAAANSTQVLAAIHSPHWQWK